MPYTLAVTRYADGPTAEVAIDIAAPPSTVWPLVIDVDLPARFSSEFKGGQWVEPATSASLGACFRGTNGHQMVGQWTTTCTVTDFVPESVFEWTVEDVANPVARWRFELHPISTGTRLVQWARMGPGRSGLTPAIEAKPDREEDIVARRLEQWRANMEATVDGIRGLAEAVANG